MVIFTPQKFEELIPKNDHFFQAGTTFSKPSCGGPPAVSFRGSIFLKHCQDRWHPFEGGRVGIPDFAYCSILITSITRFESYLISLQKLYSVSTFFFELISYQKGPQLWFLRTFHTYQPFKFTYSSGYLQQPTSPQSPVPPHHQHWDMIPPRMPYHHFARANARPT